MHIALWMTHASREKTHRLCILTDKRYCTYTHIHLISLPQTYLSCRWLYQLLLVTCTESFNGVSVVQHSMSTECSWGHILFTRRWKWTQSLRSLSLVKRDVEKYFFNHTKFVTYSTSSSKRWTSKIVNKTSVISSFRLQALQFFFSVNNSDPYLSLPHQHNLGVLQFVQLTIV